MKIRYPALTVGIPPGFRAKRQVVLMRELDVDIPDITVADAPVALRIQDRLPVQLSSAIASIEYRVFDGQLYRLSPLRVEDIADRDPLVSTIPPVDALLSLYAETLTEKSWPKGVWAQGAKCRLDPDMSAEFDRGHLVALDDEGLALLAACELFVLEQLSRYVVVEGELWESAPEPALFVDMIDGSPRGYSLDPRRDVQMLVGRYAGSAVYVSMNEAARRRGPDTPSFPRVEVARPDVLDSDFRHDNQRLLARTLESNYRQRKGDLSVRLLLSDLSATAEGRADDSGPAALDEALTGFLDACDAFERAGGNPPFSSWTREVVRLHRDMWDNRAFSISTVAPTAGI